MPEKALGYERDCDNTKKKRVEKWHEVSVPATAYLRAFSKIKALYGATNVLHNRRKVEGRQLPPDSLLSRLAAIETELKLREHAPMIIRDTGAVTTSEKSARFLFKSCLGALNEILCSSSNEKLSYVQRFVQLLQETFDYIETLRRYCFAPISNLNEGINEYCYLQTQLLQTHGTLLSLRGQQETVSETLIEAAEICKSGPMTRSDSWEHLVQSLLGLGPIFKELGMFTEALEAYEQAYSIRCEWTGPADQTLQYIAIEIAELFRRKGDF
jgi:tetratricopeptide (TPR) repeat protein